MKGKVLKKLHLWGVWYRFCMFCVNKCFAGTKYFKIKRRLLIALGYEIGQNTKVVGPLITTGSLVIGDNCWIGKNFLVNGNGWVRIGNNCDIAPEVTFLTGGHKIGTAERRAGEGEHYSISVGDGCWIGGRTTILGNTTVGKGCVVAACACVAKDIPENTLVGGVPAKVIRNL